MFSCLLKGTCFVINPGVYTLRVHALGYILALNVNVGQQFSPTAWKDPWQTNGGPYSSLQTIQAWRAVVVPKTGFISPPFQGNLYILRVEKKNLWIGEETNINRTFWTFFNTEKLWMSSLQERKISSQEGRKEGTMMQRN